MNPFLDLVDPAEQLDYWRQHLNTVRFRCTLDALLQPPTLARFYDSALLAQAPPQSFEGFTISNILDGATATYADQLYAAMARAASPGAGIVVRSFAEPATPLAAQDRSLLWGRITAQPLASVRF